MDDREPLKQNRFVEKIKGKLCGDKGYIGQALFENLFMNGIQLITKVKNKMKNSLMSVEKKPAIDVCFVKDGQFRMF